MKNKTLKLNILSWILSRISAIPMPVGVIVIKLFRVRIFVKCLDGVSLTRCSIFL